MAKVLNFGSLNVDYVYRVDRFVQPGETMQAIDLSVNAGGKGLNQSVALSRAGLEVMHAGRLGTGGEFLRDCLNDCGVDTSLVKKDAGQPGHAIIQVNSEGENAILLYAGSNRRISEDDVRAVFQCFGTGDVLVLQNEISCMDFIMRTAHDLGMRIFINPAPMDEAATNLPFEFAECVFLNEIESMTLAGARSEEDVATRLVDLFPKTLFVITRGSRGARAVWGQQTWERPAYKVSPVDTTGAGDTFTGFFVASYLACGDVEKALDVAARAAAIAITRQGACRSIPTMTEVESSSF